MAISNPTSKIHTQEPSEDFILEPTMGYSATNSYYLCEAAQIIYSDKETVEQTFKNWKFTDVEFVEQKTFDTQSVVAKNDRMIVVSFRGSESLQDWLNDASIVLVDTEVGRVHLGFRNALYAVWEQLVETITRLRDNNQLVFVTGHSLGAALATLAAARLEGETDIPVFACYNCGSPRIGSFSFSRFFKKSGLSAVTHRIVNNNDVVCKGPTNANGYLHVGNLVYIDQNGHISQGGNWWNYGKEFVAGIVKHPMDILTDDGDVGSDLITDHYIKNYLKHLNKYI
jgi:triacylglycerol lipase